MLVAIKSIDGTHVQHAYDEKIERSSLLFLILVLLGIYFFLHSTSRILIVLSWAG